MAVRGYSRPLFAADDPAADIAELERIGAGPVTVEVTHRTTEARGRLIAGMRAGDELVVTSLERLDPRLEGVVHVLLELSERRVLFRSESDPDFDLRAGSATDVLRALTDYASRSRSLATKAGMRVGKKAGRPPALDATGVAMVLELRQLGRSIPHIARVMQVGTTTVSRVVAAHEG